MHDPRRDQPPSTLRSFEPLPSTPPPHAPPSTPDRDVTYNAWLLARRWQASDR